MIDGPDQPAGAAASPLARRVGGTPMVIILILATAWFAYRGPFLGLTRGGDDFSLIYTSARAWLDGVNPYDGMALDTLWAAAGGEARLNPSKRGPHDLLYPPASLPLLAPIAAMPWPVAKTVWLVINTLMLFVGVRALAVWSGLADRRGDWAWFALIVAALLFGPAHTGIRMGQTSLCVFAFICLSNALRVSGRSMASGAALGLAVVVKPQFGVPLLVYELFRGRWRESLVAIGVAGTIGAIGVGRLSVAGVDWLPTLRENIEIFTSTGAGDPSLANGIRYQMVNAHVLWHMVVDGRGAVRLLVYGSMAAYGLAALAVWLRHREDSREMIAIGLGLTLCLMVVYHRYYDVVVLLVPAAWAISSLRSGGKDWSVWATLILLAPLALPGSAALQKAAQGGLIPDVIVGSRVWSGVFLTHQSWLIAVLGVVLVRALTTAPARQAGET